MNLVRARLTARKQKLEQANSFSLGFPAAPARPAAPAPARPEARETRSEKAYDLFLSHAREDKDGIARPLYEALTAAGISVWFDEAVLKYLDSQFFARKGRSNQRDECLLTAVYPDERRKINEILDRS